METILAHAHTLMYTILALMPSCGQGTLLGIYRWLVLSITAYLLAYWTYLSSCLPDSLDWGQAAFLALSTFLPHLVLSLLLLDIERLRPLALSHGIDITISRCKI
ncbi:hypothetical protein [Nostoc sp.]|uniref:hypothetical protein n=1 Tax=Nostoc sp. TaxID=1180 RepID=UPI002FF4703B